MTSELGKHDPVARGPGWSFGAALWLLLLGCGGGQPSETEMAWETSSPPPWDRTMALEIQAGTMGDVARQLAEQTGLPFALSGEFQPEEPLADEFFLIFPEAALKDHVQDLRDMQILDIRWQRNRFVIHEPGTPAREPGAP